MLHEQVEKVRQNEINTFHHLCDEHCNAFEKRADIYENFSENHLRSDAEYNFDNFRSELLKHLS